MRLSKIEKIRSINTILKEIIENHKSYVLNDNKGSEKIHDIKDLENSLEWAAMLDLYFDLPNLSDNVIFTKTTNTIYQNIQVLKRDKVVSFDNATFKLI
jgi:hypothetical protein